MIPPTDIDLDHVAVATEEAAAAWPRYAGELGGVWLAGGGTAGFWSGQVRYANGMKVEVLEPCDVELNDFLRRFLDRSGPGPHHLTFKVADIQAALGEAEAAGYRPVGVDLSDEDWKEAFLHPKDAPGVVVQLAQSGGGDWVSEPPPGFPAQQPDQPATLEHVTHAVARLDDGLRLFAGLLSGEELQRGEDEAGRWVDLGWRGPGRVRLVEPTNDRSPIANWLGDRAGRVHHLAFTVPGGEGTWEVPPEENLGVRLVLRGEGAARA